LGLRIEEKAENSGVRGKAWCIADRAWGHSWNIGMVEGWNGGHGAEANLLNDFDGVKGIGCWEVLLKDKK